MFLVCRNEIIKHLIYLVKVGAEQKGVWKGSNTLGLTWSVESILCLLTVILHIQQKQSCEEVMRGRQIPLIAPSSCCLIGGNEGGEYISVCALFVHVLSYTLWFILSMSIVFWFVT